MHVAAFLRVLRVRWVLRVLWVPWVVWVLWVPRVVWVVGVTQQNEALRPCRERWLRQNTYTPSCMRLFKATFFRVCVLCKLFILLIAMYIRLFPFIDSLAKFVMTLEAHQLTCRPIAQLTGSLIAAAVLSASSLRPLQQSSGRGLLQRLLHPHNHKCKMPLSFRISLSLP